MLSLLHIENIAVIECADISFDAGFNILTGSHGQIIEQGTHGELLEKKGKYYDLYTLQYSKEQLKNEA